jgi:hypothetical protein
MLKTESTKETIATAFASIQAPAFRRHEKCSQAK